MQFRELDEYIYNYIKNKIENDDKTLNQDIFDILKMRHIKGFDNYSREVLSLALKKRMTIVIENYMLKNNDTFFNKENYEDFLFNYVELFIKEFYQPIKKEDFIEIDKKYNSRIYEAKQKLASKPLILPNGEVIIVEDIIIAIEKLLENKKIDAYKLKEINNRIKKVAVLYALFSGLAITSLNNQEEKKEHTEIIETTEKDKDFYTSKVVKQLSEMIDNKTFTDNDCLEKESIIDNKFEGVNDKIK